MSREVLWTKVILEQFIAEGCLTDDEERVLRVHVAGWSRVKIADSMNISVPTVDRIIARLKKKYDAVQRYDPILPPRRKYHELLNSGK